MIKFYFCLEFFFPLFFAKKVPHFARVATNPKLRNTTHVLGQKKNLSYDKHYLKKCEYDLKQSHILSLTKLEIDMK